MGLYSGGLIIGRIFAFVIWGANVWRGLFLEGHLFGISRYAFIPLFAPCLSQHGHQPDGGRVPSLFRFSEYYFLNIDLYYQKNTIELKLSILKN